MSTLTEIGSQQHCQKLAPELIRAADGLHPLVPVYAVDCDDAKNKALCAEQVRVLFRNTMALLTYYLGRERVSYGQGDMAFTSLSLLFISNL